MSWKLLTEKFLCSMYIALNACKVSHLYDKSNFVLISSFGKADDDDFHYKTDEYVT